MQKLLNSDFNRAMYELCKPIKFDAVDVAPDNFIDLMQASQCDTLKVWEGASDATIFGDAKLNHMFRAWHDLHHIEHKLAFNPAGEAMACHYQQLDILEKFGDNTMTRLFNQILDIEINKQIEYFETNGLFVEDQLQFARHHLSLIKR